MKTLAFHMMKCLCVRLEPPSSDLPLLFFASLATDLGDGRVDLGLVQFESIRAMNIRSEHGASDQGEGKTHHCTDIFILVDSFILQNKRCKYIMAASAVV